MWISCDLFQNKVRHKNIEAFVHECILAISTGLRLFYFLEKGTWGLSDVSICDEQLGVSGLHFSGETFYSFIYIFFEASNHDFWFIDC